jgi:hypothetical protein
MSFDLVKSQMLKPQVLIEPSRRAAGRIAFGNGPVSNTCDLPKTDSSPAR